jgi:hypothetical protein
MDDNLPETQPSGSLVPPPRVPPGAVAAAAPLPPSRPSSSAARRRETGLRGLLVAALDGLDTLGDRIAGAVGLR